MTMNTTTRISIAERLGHSVGRGWRSYTRRERDALGRLVSLGIPAMAATALIWAAKLAVLGALLYMAFWFALGLVCVLLVASGFAKGDNDFPSPNTELRHGEAGFGLYSSDGHRLDPHDPNDPYDD